MENNPTQIQSVLTLYNQGYIAFFDETGRIQTRIKVEEMCDKDIEVLLHEVDYSYAAIIRRYQTHKDYARFVHEMTVSSVIRCLKNQLTGTNTADVSKLNEEIKSLEEENKHLLNENMSLKRTDDELSYEELKQKCDQAVQTAKDLNAKLKEKNEEYDKLKLEYDALNELVPRDEPEPTEAENPMPEENQDGLQEINLHTDGLHRFTYNLMINDICCCTIHRTYKNPPVDDNRQWNTKFICTDSLSQAINDILNYDTGTAEVYVGQRCLYNASISRGDYEIIDHILNGVINELDEDMMKRPVYVDFTLTELQPLIRDFDGGLYYTFTFRSGNRPVNTKIMRIDAPIVQAMKACQTVIGKKVADPMGRLSLIDSVDVRQIYEVHDKINAANVASVCLDEAGRVCIDGLWYDPMSPVEPENFNGERYFINFYSGEDHTSVGCVISADSFSELKSVIERGFTNTGEFVRVYNADTNSFIQTIYPINEHK